MTMFEAGATTWLIVLVSAAVLASGPSHLANMTGSGRKIRIFLNKHYLQLNSNGTVSGADDQTVTSEYRTFKGRIQGSILLRSSVNVGQVKLKGVTTCMYLCMNVCGLPYASRGFTDECVFNEAIGDHYYNSYTSTKYSNSNRTFYLGMRNTGVPRKVLVRSGRNLGTLSQFTRALTQPVEAIEAANLGAINCDKVPRVEMARPKCKKRRKLKKGLIKAKKRRPEGGEQKGPGGNSRCGEGCRLKKLLINRKRKSRFYQRPAHQIRHRKHRMAARLSDDEDEKVEEEDEAEEVEDEDEEVDVTTADDDMHTFDDQPENLLDNERLESRNDHLLFRAIVF
ncbi:uncharacterized protein LOC106665308 isoform X2 [Cimex lectularius]|uniref:Fibroblast growth factor n=1 Tax=Cimex lectularius TaxID=79782 RepID=A0A8I6SMV7_CIMLE|nr:uncharacterized protein LOC106665308 isoform X2 [Cimex lectularius]